MSDTPTPKSRAEAIRLGQKKYFTGKPCKYGHVAARSINGFCTECARERACRRREENPELYRERVRNSHRKRREENPELMRQIDSETYQRHRDQYIDRARKWRLNNPERYCELARERRKSDPERFREYQRNWQSKNLEQHCYKQAKRRASKINATPHWLTEKQESDIRKIYESCPDGFHVDHIVPLQGRNVCGLHVPWNLQHLDATENQSKSNHYEDMQTE